jgi:hypothetical protein
MSLTEVERCKLNLKAKVESSLSHFSFKSIGPGNFNMGFIGSTCTAPPRRPPTATEPAASNMELP